MNDTITYKTCSKCGVEKPGTEYHKSQTNRDRLNHKCKSCVKEDTLIYQANNPNCNCDFCKKNFYKNKSRQKNTINNFCSFKCYTDFEWIKINKDLNEGKKTCSMCEERKELALFIKDKDQRDGYSTSCKSCAVIIRRKSKEKKMRTFVSTITEKKCKCCNEIKPVDKFKIQITTKDGYSPKCYVCHNEEGKKLRKKRIETNQYSETPINKKCCRCKKVQHKDNFYLSIYSRDKLRSNCISCEILLREKYKESITIRRRERYNNDPIFKLKKLLRGRIKKYIDRKSVPMNSIIGCNWETLKNHIESQFTEGMTWDNHGYKGWHIDHHIPLNSANTDEEIYQLNHYTNLKPLWWDENLKKGDKISEEWGNA